jgi:hypothetical protein
MKKPFPSYNLRLFDVLTIIIGLYLSYKIYEYGVYGYLKKRREKKDRRIKKIINYIN